jgi:multicomponent Na+:H+ antiporter subunit G
MSAWIADGLVVLGVAAMTIGVYGMFRMPDIYMKIHAVSKAIAVGVFSLLAASFVTDHTPIVARVVLIGVLLLVTTPVSAHVIARAADRHDREPRT